MAQYLAIPKAANAVVEVATGAALKTVLQVAPVTQALRVVAWGVSSDAAAAAAAGIVELIDVNVAATVTSLTPELWESPDLQAARAVGGAAATGYNATAEGTVTASRLLDAVELRPDGDKYVIWLPCPPKVAAGRFLRVRATFAATVNVIPWVLFDEE